MELGERLKKARLARGLGVNQLGALSGVSGATISSWESGRRNPSIPSMRKVLKVLRISYEDLFIDYFDDYVKSRLTKSETTAEDVRVVLTAHPHLEPAEVEVIMRIVESKERESRGGGEGLEAAR